MSGPKQREETMTDEPKLPAVAGPLDGPVRPAAWVIEYSGDERELYFERRPYGIAQRPLYDQAALDAWRNAAHEAAGLSKHMHSRNTALMLLISDLVAAMARIGAGIDHLDNLAREWEPDHSSGADRAGWVRAKDAADEARRLIAGIPSRMKA